MKFNRSIILLLCGAIYASVGCGRSGKIREALPTDEADTTFDGDSSWTTDSAENLDGGADDGGETKRITIGIEYVPIDNERFHVAIAEQLKETGVTAVKPLPASFEWGKMVSGPGEEPDTSSLDSFVREWQARGFSHIILGLRSHSTWGSVDWGPWGGSNPSPKPEYLEEYQKWVRHLVERYDMDNDDDMPGLIFPIRHFEIGVEFSSYEPEPVADYLKMLKAAYEGAHDASSDVVIGHAAFLAINAFKDSPPTNISYEDAFESIRVEKPNGEIRGGIRTLKEMRGVLAAAEYFDVINLHSLGDASEIEGLVQWIQYETAGKPGYPKPMIISDTTNEPFAMLGWADTCSASTDSMGLMVHPAKEEDRCRVAKYFQQLLNEDEETVRWVQGFSARDLVKKVVVAAEQGVEWINTWSVGDVEALKWRWVRASGGNTGWAGMIELSGFGFSSVERRASFYALKQLMEELKGHTSISRVSVPDKRHRLYSLKGSFGERFIAWYQREQLVLPGETVPASEVTIETQASSADVAKVICEFGVTSPKWETIHSHLGRLTVSLTPTPVYIHLKF